MKTHKSILLSKEDLGKIEWLLRQVTDHMAFDDRPDHGLNMVKNVRYLSDDQKSKWYELSGRLTRAYRRME